ncbi:MAG: transglycosylase SLT domain-containing protein [SAR324 cluster bacterium]|nr:transglycosylase SLT domain-containing protein [SAR324 cluster bacterium]
MLFIFIGTGYSQTAETDPNFPVFPALKQNINFWEKVYSIYSSTQGIIHDTDDLSIVYDVIDLESRNRKGARRTNLNAIRKVKAHYRKLLRNLAQHPDSQNSEERRIATLFGEKATSANFLSAADNIRFQRGQRNFFQAGLVRSGGYITEIKKIFARHELPKDLIYLPHVESSFNLQAYSKFGAAGIWQFTYHTGKRFLKVDYTVDQRWDPLYASEAAAQLLKYNYKMLGSWPLALTAYNHGAKAMSRAKKAKGNYKTIFHEYDGRRFGFASRNFYAEFLAARNIAKNYEDYFPGLILDQPLKTKSISLKGFISADLLAKHLNLSLKTIRLLNLSLREPVFRDQKFIPKDFQLHLPDIIGLDHLVASIPENFYKPEQKRSRFYWVRKGDVASVIATRHGITLQDLIWANNLDYRARIYAGQNLRIPSQEDTLLLAAKFKSSTDLKEPQATKERISSNDQQETSKESSLAAQNVKPVAISKEVNGVNPSIVTGNILVKREFTDKGIHFGVIQVETRETLGHFADWLQVSIQTIRKQNQLSYGEDIRMDQTLVIPFTQIDKEQFEEKRYEFHKESEEDFLSAYEIDGVTTYNVRRGDNIWTLCKERFELPVWLIKKYNLSVDLNKLTPGQKIVVPIVENKTDS